MKSLLYTLLIAFMVGAFACNDKDEPGNTPPKKRIDTNATIYVKPKATAERRNLKIGEMSYQDSLKFIAKWALSWNFREADGRGNGRLILNNRDTIKNEFRWFGTDVMDWGLDPITNDTIYKLGRRVTELTNFVVIAGIHKDGTPYQWDDEKPDYTPIPDEDIDTIAYIPNDVLLKAREKITEAFNNGDYERVYELFDSAYVFIPITGERYKELINKN